ncbi:DUF4232 domain-containing protein [Saccharopolyspora rosea]|uniref:DUF4232 domain-containing protein n=1 Tax=Saccharopolyspora rosea TaxID=524884 RepID=A0ABW3FKJ0_9PSEU|nr:DUF4232 domain-containing protein [Saccharopolyspora rosea]
MTPRRFGIIGVRTLQVTGALLAVAAMAGCGARPAQSGQAADSARLPAASPVEPAPATSAAAPAAQQDEAPQRNSDATSSRPASDDTQVSRAAQGRQAQADRCHTSMLTGAVQQADAGAGQRYGELVLRNTSDETCTLYGYGGMQLLGSDGKALPTTMKRSPNPGPSLIRLAPGQSAQATLHWTVVPHSGEPTDGQCQPTPVRAYVTPPDETDPLTVTWNLGPVCGFGSIDGSAYHR